MASFIVDCKTEVRWFGRSAVGGSVGNSVMGEHCGVAI